MDGYLKTGTDHPPQFQCRQTSHGAAGDCYLHLHILFYITSTRSETSGDFVPYLLT